MAQGVRSFLSAAFPGAVLVAAGLGGIFFLNRGKADRPALGELTLKLHALSGELDELRASYDFHRQSTERQLKFLKDLAEGWAAAPALPPAGSRPEVAGTPQPKERLERCIAEHREYREWTPAKFAADPNVNPRGLGLSAEDAAKLEAALSRHRSRMDTLWEQHHSVLDSHILRRMKSGEYEKTGPGIPSPKHDQALVSSVVVGNLCFDFPRADYPDLVETGDLVGEVRMEMASDVIRFFEELSK